MTISAGITSELMSLQAQVAAAEPLANATRAAVVALQLNAGQLVSDVQAALTAPSNTLDTWIAPSDPSSIVSGFLNVASVAQDQDKLSLMRGLVGRVASNLDQI